MRFIRPSFDVSALVRSAIGHLLNRELSGNIVLAFGPANSARRPVLRIKFQFVPAGELRSVPQP